LLIPLSVPCSFFWLATTPPVIYAIPNNWSSYFSEKRHCFSL
jgi:hypothetical protein